MNCRDAELMLTAYHEGDLTPGQREELKKHLDCCPQCRAVEEQLRQVHERLVGFFDKHQLPADFDTLVLGAVGKGHRTSAEPAFSWRALAKWGSIAAAAALGITLILASLWDVGEVPASPGSTAAVGESGKEAPEHEGSRAYLTREGKQQEKISKPHEQQQGTPREVEVAGRDTETAGSQKPVTAQQAAPRETAPEGEGGHGRPADVGEGLLASPHGTDGGPAVTPRERRKRPDGQRVGPRRPGQLRPGRQGPQDEADRRRELADRVKRRREALRENLPAEMAGLDAEQRRKLASGIKESTDRGIPPAVAARVVHLVLKKGLSVDDALKALRALNEAVGKGVRPALFAAGLERVLGSIPEGASFEKALKRLVESLGSAGGNGKTN
jgi:hypothetical protein